jgi:hypothetical protein
VPFRHSFALIAFERGISVYLLALGTAAAAAIRFLQWPDIGPALAVIGAMSALPMLAGAILRHLTQPWLRRSIWRGRLATHVDGLITELGALLTDQVLVVAWSLTTAATLALVALQFFALSHSVGNGMAYSSAWLAFGASQLAGIASLLPLGLGVSDGSLLAISVRLGMPTSDGLALVLLVRAAVAFPLVIAAAASYFYLILRCRPLPDVTAMRTAA